MQGQGAWISIAVIILIVTGYSITRSYKFLQASDHVYAGPQQDSRASCARGLPHRSSAYRNCGIVSCSGVIHFEKQALEVAEAARTPDVQSAIYTSEVIAVPLPRATCGFMQHVIQSM